MSSIDQRIVGLRFDNKQFEQGVGETMSSLDRLKSGLEMEGVGGSLDKAGSKFSAFAAIGFSALQRLTNGAIDMGQKIAGAVLDPLVEGGKKRALNIEQAKFQFQGLGMDVEASMESALGAVKGTAFGLDEAAVVAAQFGASGMAAGEDMTNALRGISGVAAMAGSSYSDVGNIFTKVAGQGRLMGDDLNRLAVRGVNAAATLADSMGITEEQVRKMVTKGEIDFQTFADAMSEAFGEHATKANETYTGSLSNMRAAISRIGASFATSNFEKQRQIFNALTPVIDKVADALQPVMDLFDEMAMAKAGNMVAFLEGLDLTDLTKAIEVAVSGVRILRGAFSSYMGAIKNAWNEVFPKKGGPSTILTTLAGVFQKFAKALVPSATNLKVVGSIAKVIFSLFKGGVTTISSVATILGTSFKVLWGVLSALGGFITPLIGTVGRFIASFSSGNKEIQKTTDVLGIIQNAMAGFERFMTRFISVINNVADAFATFLSGDKESAAKKLGASFNPLIPIAEGLAAAWRGFADAIMSTLQPAINFLQGAWSIIKAIVGGIGSALSAVGGALGTAFAGLGSGAGAGLSGMMDNLGFEHILGAINVGMIVSLATTIKSFLKALKPFADIARRAGGALSELSGVFKAMQTDIKATALLKIAAAIAVLAIAIILLSLVDTDKLLGSAAAIATAAGVLMGGMMTISMIAKGGAVAKMNLIALALVLFATSLAIVSAAITRLSALGWEQLSVGLIGLAAGMAILVGAALLISNFSGPMSKAAFSLTAMSTALYLMAGVIAIFGVMPMDMLIQGGLAVISVLGAMAVVALVLGNLSGQMLKASIGLMAMAMAINMLLVPIIALGLLPFDILLQGMVSLGLILLGLTATALLLGVAGPSMALAAVGLMALAVAINLLVLPIILLGAIPYETLIQGLLALAGVLAVLVIAALAMSGAAVGAVGMIAMAGAILILSFALQGLAALGLTGIAVAILGLVAALAIFGVTAMLLTPVGPMMLLLGAAVALLGVGMLALSIAAITLAPAILAVGGALALLGGQAGDILLASLALTAAGVALIAFGVGVGVAAIGVAALGIGLVLLGAGMVMVGSFGVIAATGLAAFAVALDDLAVGKIEMAALGLAFAALGAGLLVLGAGLLLVGAGALIAAVGMALLGVVGYLAANATDSFRMALERINPQIPTIDRLGRSLDKLGGSLKKVSSNASSSASGLTRMNGYLRTSTGSLKTFTESLSATSASSGRLFNVFVRSIQQGGRGINTEFRKIVGHFNNFSTQLNSTRGRIQSTVTNIMNAIGRGIQTGSRNVSTRLASVVREFSTFATNLGRQAPRVATEGRNIINGLGRAILGAIPGITTSIRNGASNIGSAIVDGIVRGISNNSHRVSTASSGVANRALVSARQTLEIRSPSRAMFKIGTQTTQGLADGLSYLAGTVGDSASDVGNTALDELKRVMAEISEVVMADGDFVIRPVLDLSDVHRQAQELSSIFGGNSLGVQGDYDRAQTISTMRAPTAVEPSGLDEIAAAFGTVINYEQNITSPKALSELDIYRNTNNSLAFAARSLRRLNESS